MDKKLIDSLARLCAKFDEEYGKKLKADAIGETMDFEEFKELLKRKKTFRATRNLCFRLFSTEFYPKRLSQEFKRKFKIWHKEHEEELAIEYL